MGDLAMAAAATTAEVVILAVGAFATLLTAVVGVLQYRHTRDSAKAASPPSPPDEPTEPGEPPGSEPGGGPRGSGTGRVGTENRSRPVQAWSGVVRLRMTTQPLPAVRTKPTWWHEQTTGPANAWASTAPQPRLDPPAEPVGARAMPWWRDRDRQHAGGGSGAERT